MCVCKGVSRLGIRVVSLSLSLSVCVCSRVSHECIACRCVYVVSVRTY